MLQLLPDKCAFQMEVDLPAHISQHEPVNPTLGPCWDLRRVLPFKNVSPPSTAWHKSGDADWDIPIWLLAKCLGLVMNAAIGRWCMKIEAHHYLLSIKPEHSSCFFFPPQGGIVFWIQNNTILSSFFFFNLFIYNRNHLMICDSGRNIFAAVFFGIWATVG